jgi:hypothetical protein
MLSGGTASWLPFSWLLIVDLLVWKTEFILILNEVAGAINEGRRGISGELFPDKTAGTTASLSD